jgi:hypothetical protein
MKGREDKMLRFESWPPEPDATFITDSTKAVISDTFESIAVRAGTAHNVGRGIVDLLFTNADLSGDRAQQFFDSLSSQVPETSDFVRDHIVGQLHSNLLGVKHV